MSRLVKPIADRSSESEPAFYEVRAPSIDELQALLSRIIQHILKLLTRTGYLIEERACANWPKPIRIAYSRPRRQRPAQVQVVVQEAHQSRTFTSLHAYRRDHRRARAQHASVSVSCALAEFDPWRWPLGQLGVTRYVVEVPISA